jgi:large subunit ribosomal protein L1
MAKQKMKTVDMSVSVDELDEKKAKKAAKSKEVAAEVEIEEVTTERVRPVHMRSAKYTRVKSFVDRTKSYPINQALELVLKTSYSKFTGTVIVDLVVRDEKVSAEVAFPHSTGKTVRVAVTSDELLANVEKGIIDFDILVSHPSFMPKIARLAKILGPKGLMPNPKNNTVSTDPEKRAKELSGGKVTIKSERKAPLIHAIIGKTDMLAKELAANAEALVKAVSTGKILKMTVSSTMSPGVKVDLTKFSA